MINLIPMAGEGSRFKLDGYSDPKPLIKVSGKPMVCLASDFLPVARQWIYICRKGHVEEFQIDQVLKQNNPNALILSVDKLTEGQASTCLLAKDFINNDEELMIAASDNGMIWENEKFESLKNEYDCLVWTFRNNVTVNENPKAYGWVVVNEENTVMKVSVKVPISDHYINDHAIVGAFWFKKGSLFVDAAESMIKKNRRVNNEFYVDESINELVEKGFKVGVMEIDHYICWGTPNDLKTFEYWQSFFDRSKYYNYSLENDRFYAK